MTRRLRPDINRITRRLLASFGMSLLSLLALEGLVRWWGYAEHYIYDPIYMPYPASDDIAYVHTPNLESVRARGEIFIQTDSLGLRADVPGKTYPHKQPGEIRIAIAGDSITFGEGVADVQETYPAVLEKHLAEQTGLPVTVFNFGVSGYSVREMTATLENRMLALEPDLVIMAIVPQDFVLSRTGAVDPTGYVYDPINGLVKENWRLRKLLQNIRLFYVLRDIGVKLAPSLAQPPLPSVPGSYKYVQNFRDVAEANHIPYLILWLPVLQSDSTFNELVKTQILTDQIHLLDLSHVRHAFTETTFAASAFDGHPSSLVHQQIAAELLGPARAELGLNH